MGIFARRPLADRRPEILANLKDEPFRGGGRLGGEWDGVGECGMATGRGVVG